MRHGNKRLFISNSIDKIFPSCMPIIKNHTHFFLIISPHHICPSLSPSHQEKYIEIIYIYIYILSHTMHSHHHFPHPVHHADLTDGFRRACHGSFCSAFPRFRADVLQLHFLSTHLITHHNANNIRAHQALVDSGGCACTILYVLALTLKFVFFKFFYLSCLKKQDITL